MVRGDHDVLVIVAHSLKQQTTTYNQKGLFNIRSTVITCFVQFNEPVITASSSITRNLWCIRKPMFFIRTSIPVMPRKSVKSKP